MPRHRETADSNTYRFFVDPRAISGGRARLDDPELCHQIAGVLRLGPGDRVTLLDGAGRQLTVVLDDVPRRGPVTGAVEREDSADASEPPLQLTLYLPIIRPERFEWALQKGVELGVAAFVPTLCARSISEGGPAARKLERWRKIVREAAEQSRRGRIPPLADPIPFADACDRAAGGRAILLWEGSGAPGLRRVLRTQIDQGPRTKDQRPEAAGQADTAEGETALADQKSAATASSAPSSLAARPWSILSGPEGGLTPDERHAAATRGIMEVSLGPRTLRAETAPIAAAAAIMYELGALE